MADWDADSAQLEQNLRSVLETIQDDSRRRTDVCVETARLWHTGILRGLAVPDPHYIGRFRGEPGLEKVQVHVGGRYGVAAHEATTALAAFERTLQTVADFHPNARLSYGDRRAIVAGELSTQQVEAIRMARVPDQYAHLDEEIEE